MKIIRTTIVMLSLILLAAIQAICQVNPFTNGFEEYPPAIPAVTVSTDQANGSSSLSGVSCTGNSFWAISSYGIDQYSLFTGGVTKIGTTVIADPFDPNLAYCNNLNGGVYSPTFYSVQGHLRPAYYDGTGVVVTGVTATNLIVNCGGYGNYLYYMLFDTVNYHAISIQRFDGTSLTDVFIYGSSLDSPVMDISVDSLGNAWIFTGPDKYNSENIRVVSPDGQELKNYPFMYNTTNAYGSFFLHETLYVGLGSSNPDHPNTLLPVTFIGDSAYVGTPIPMPSATFYWDLASCTVGSPLSTPEHRPLQDVSAFPDPFTSCLTVSLPAGGHYDLSLLDITGKEVMRQSFAGTITLNTGSFPCGIYIYRITDRTGNIRTGKVVKE
jgi:hypothetical protein